MTTARLALVGALMLTLSATGWSSDVASAAPAPAAVKLSITVTDNTALVHPKSSTEYRATVTNEGSRPAHGTLVLTAPEYVRYQHVRGNGKKTNGEVRWKITVGAGQAVTERVSAWVRTIPKSSVRLTTLASFYLGAVSGTPVIRTADADRIAGVKDPAPVSVAQQSAPAHPHRKASSAPDDGTLGGLGWSLVGGGVLVVLLAAGVLARLWRRRGPESRSDTHRDQADGGADDGLALVTARPSGDDS